MAAGWVGAHSTAYAEINVTGDVTPLYDGSDPWYAGDHFYLGETAEGSMRIDNASAVSSQYARVGDLAGITGTAEVTGDGSLWTISDTLNLAVRGTGYLTIADAGAASGNYANVGALEGAYGYATVTGVGSRWDVNRELTIGVRGTGEVRVESGGYLQTGDLTIGDSSTGAGTLTVTGAGSHWHNRHDVWIRGLGVQGVEIRDGGLFTSNGLVYITNQFVVSDVGSRWESLEKISVNGTGGLLEIRDGGVVNSAGEAELIGAGARAIVQQAQWNHTGTFSVGGATNGSSVGTLHLNAGGVVNVTGNTFINLRSYDDSIIHFDGGTLNTDGLFAAPETLRGTGTLNTRGLVGDLDVVYDASNALSHQVPLAPITGEDVTINIDTPEAGNTGALGAGYLGAGSLTIADGRVISSGEGFLGYNVGASGTATVSGAGSQWDIAGDLFVGREGQGGLTIAEGAVVTNDEAAIGAFVGSHGAVTVTGAASQFISSRNMSVGGSSSGELLIENGAEVSNYSLFAGGSVSADITVRGIGSELNSENELRLSSSGYASLTIEDGGVVNTGDLAQLADGVSSVGTAVITGSGSQWNVGRKIEIGNGNNTLGKLEIYNAGQVNSDYITMGFNGTSNGTILIDGTGSRLNNNIDLYVGRFHGHGSITIENGGSFLNGQDVIIADRSSATGTITVTGQGSSFNYARNLYVGENGMGTLAVTDGGLVSGYHTYIGYKDDAVGTATVDGVGSQWTTQNILEVGRDGDATLTILNGGVVNSGSAQGIVLNGLTRGYYASAWIGYGNASTGTLTVDGPGSRWNNAQDLLVGIDGTATLNIRNGGLVQSNGITVVDHESGAGSVQLTNGTLTTGGLLTPNSALLGTGTINTHSVVGDYDMVFDATTGPQQQTTLNALPGQNVTINYDNAQPAFVENDSFLGAGYESVGSITIAGGASLATVDGFLGYKPGAEGTATVTGTSSAWNLANGMLVGNQGTGTFNIQDGGTVNHGNAYNDNLDLVSRSVSHAGSFSRRDLPTGFFLGYQGTGTLNIEDGGTLNIQYTTVNVPILDPDSPGPDFIDTPHNMAIGLYVGYQGVGTLNIQNGGTLNSLYSNIGVSAAGTVLLDGPGSQWHNAITLRVGDGAAGDLTIQNGAILTNGGPATIGYYFDTTGQVTVDGSESQLNNADDLYVGHFGTGTLNIQNNAAVNVSQSTWIGVVANTGTINFDNATLNTSGLLARPESFLGHGTINTNTLVTDLDLVFSSPAELQQQLVLNAQPGQNITLNIDASQAANNRQMGAGYAGVGSLTLNGGTQLGSTEGYLGYIAGSAGTANITGAGTRWDNAGQLFVGLNGTGTLNITDGAVVSNLDGYLGYTFEAAGTATVAGAGTRWDNLNALTVGMRGTGMLIVADGAVVSGLDIFVGVDRNGSTTSDPDLRNSVNVSGTGPTNQGLLLAAHAIRIGSGGQTGGSINVYQHGVVSAGTQVIVRSGQLGAGGGTVIAPLVRVEAGGVLTGAGISPDALTTTIQGNLNNAGRVAPGGSPGILAITGDYTQTPTGTLGMQIAGHTVGTEYDLLAIDGNATLDGTLSVELLDDFVPAAGDVFGFIDYAGFAGSFSMIQGPELDDGLHFLPIYTADGFELAVVQPGDLNADGQIDQEDLNGLLVGWGSTVAYAAAGDWTHDSRVGIDDLTITLRNWTGSAAPVFEVPEPGTAVMLALLTAIGLRRRRAA